MKDKKTPKNYISWDVEPLTDHPFDMGIIKVNFTNGELRLPISEALECVQ